MGPRYDISEYDVRQLIITKDDLLEPPWGAGTTALRSDGAGAAAHQPDGAGAGPAG
jgi:hypothetical protein